MKDIREDINSFYSKVSSFSGERAEKTINKWFDKVGFAEKEKRYIMKEQIPLTPSTINRNYSSRVFNGSMSFNTFQKIISSIYNIPKPGDIDSIYGYMLCNFSDFTGILFTDFLSTYIVKELNDYPILDIYAKSDIEFNKSSASLFLVGSLEPMVDKYEHLTYDYLMLQAGMIIQNSYIFTTNNNIKNIALGCYDKQKVHELFNLKNTDLVLTNILYGL